MTAITKRELLALDQEAFLLAKERQTEDLLAAHRDGDYQEFDWLIFVRGSVLRKRFYHLNRRARTLGVAELPHPQIGAEMSIAIEAAVAERHKDRER